MQQCINLNGGYVKNRKKSKFSKDEIFNRNRRVFYCEKSLGTLFYGQLSCVCVCVCSYLKWEGEDYCNSQIQPHSA